MKKGDSEEFHFDIPKHLGENFDSVNFYIKGYYIPN